jgi:hypothetical protein
MSVSIDYSRNNCLVTIVSYGARLFYTGVTIFPSFYGSDQPLIDYKRDVFPCVAATAID